MKVSRFIPIILSCVLSMNMALTAMAADPESIPETVPEAADVLESEAEKEEDSTGEDRLEEAPAEDTVEAETDGEADPAEEPSDSADSMGSDDAEPEEKDDMELDEKKDPEPAEKEEGTEEEIIGEIQSERGAAKEAGAARLIEEISFSFSNSRSGFGYPSDYKIPLSAYQVIFGNNTRADAEYASHNNAWSGNNVGMVAAAALLTTEGSGVTPAMFHWGAAAPKDLAVSDYSSHLSMSLTEFIEALQVSQYTEAFSDERKSHQIYTSAIRSGNANIDSIYDEVKSKADEGIPTIMTMVDGAGLALLAYRTEEISGTESRIYVYDCNFPLQERYMTVRKSGGHFTEWSYDMGTFGEWGTSSESSRLSYISYAAIKSIWDNREGKADLDENGTSKWLKDYTYTTDNGILSLTAYTGSEARVCVPGSAYVSNVLYDKVYLTKQMWGSSVTGLSFEKGVTLPSDSSDMFTVAGGGGDTAANKGLTDFDGTNLDTSSVTDMSGMFCKCSALVNVNVSGFDTSSVTDMTAMFSLCVKLKDLDLSSFNTSRVTNMQAMFFCDQELQSLDLSSFDTSSVTGMGSMFYHCSALTRLDLSNFDTSSVKDMETMFCMGYSTEGGNLEYLDVSSFDTSSVTNMKGMFWDCRKLKTLDVSGFDTSAVTDMSLMFYECRGLKALDVSGFNTSSVKDMNGMFYGCGSLTSLDVSGFDTSSVTAMYEMFSECGGLTGLDLRGFDTSSVENMQFMFYNCRSLESLDLSHFNTSSVQNMTRMFSGCDGLKSLDLSGFDMSGVTAAADMLKIGTSSEECFKIRTPRNTALEITLPVSGGLFYDRDGKTLSVLPMNASASSLIVQNWVRPVITSHPASVTAKAGTDVVFEASFEGSYEYGKWQYREAGGSVWTDLKQEKDRESLKTLTFKAAPEWDGRSVRLVLLDAWDRETASQEAVLTIEEEGLSNNQYSFSFGNSRSAFGYPADYRIPLSAYQIIYGDNIRAEVLFASHPKWEGNCMGISASSALLASAGSGIGPGAFKAGAVLPKDLSVGDTSASLSMSLTAFIEALHTVQYTDAFSSERKAHRVYSSAVQAGNANLDGIYNAVKEKAASGIPTILTLVQDGGHAVLAYKTEEVSAAEARIYIYDSNFPLQDRYITLTKSGGHYTGWSYDIQASATNGGSIDPRGTTSVRGGESVTYTFTPDNGYEVSDVFVDGDSIGPASSYTFKNITRHHTIMAAFRKKAAALSGTIRASLVSDGTGTAVTTAPSGTKVLISAEGAGGSAPYTYKFLIYDNGAKTWYKLRDFTSTSTYTWTPGVAGTKTLFVDIKDASGTTCRAKLSGFVVTEKQTALSGTVKASLVSDSTGAAITTAPSGSKVLITAKGAGGSGGYTYKFLIYDNGAKTWYKFRDFTSTNTYTWTPGVTGTKTLFVDVKDSAGTTVRVKLSGFAVTEKQTALAGSVKASLAGDASGKAVTTARSGTKVLITAKGSGGSGSYTYKFLIYDNGAGAWFKLRDFTATNTYNWTTGATGTKTLFVDIKDSAGTTVRVKLSGFIVTAK